MADNGNSKPSVAPAASPSDGTGSRLRPWTAPPPSPRGPVTQVVELKDMVVAYAKQETVEPLKTLQRYVAFGLSGAIAIGLGLCFVLLGMLRGMQEFDLFNDPGTVDGGTWSWVPYAVTALVGAILATSFLHRLYRFTQQGTSR